MVVQYRNFFELESFDISMGDLHNCRIKFNLRNRLFSQFLAITPAGPESGAELDISMRQVQDRLGETGRLYDTSHFDCAFAFDEAAHGTKK